MAPGRRVLGGLVGIGSALPLVVIAAVPVVAGGLPPAGAVALLPGLAALLAAGLAGAGAGADPPYARSAALAAAAPVAMGLSFVAAATFVASWAMSRLLEGVAMFGPAGIAEGFGSVAAASLLRTAGAVLALIPILALALWAWARSRPHPPRIVAAALCFLVALAVIGLDGLAARPSADLLARLKAGSPPPAISDREPGESADSKRVFVLKRSEEAASPEPELAPEEPELVPEPELDLADEDLVIGIPESPPPPAAEGPIRYLGGPEMTAPPASGW